MPSSVDTASHLLDLVYTEHQQVFALLDAARDPRIFELIRGSNLPHASLFEGREGQYLERVAPYVIALPREAPLWADLLGAWGQSWGIYLNAPADILMVRDHVRKNLKIEAPNGAELYFRFYDPRVLRSFLVVCTAEECAEVFGPVSRFIMESEDPAFAVEFQRTTGMATRQLVRISPMDMPTARYPNPEAVP